MSLNDGNWSREIVSLRQEIVKLQADLVTERERAQIGGDLGEHYAAVARRATERAELAEAEARHIDLVLSQERERADRWRRRARAMLAQVRWMRAAGRFLAIESVGIKRVAIGAIRDAVQNGAGRNAWAERAMDESLAVAHQEEQLDSASRRAVVLHAEIGRLQQGRDAALGALRTIRDEYGQVCEDFGACEHPACRASHSAWLVADEALRGLGL